MSIQLRNDQMVSLLKPDFQYRAEPNFSFAKSSGVHLMLPQLRGFWPFSSVDENGDVFDLSGQARTLTNNSATPFGTSGLAVYADPDGTADYFSRADEAGLDIVDAISFGGWFRFDAKSNCGLIGKWNTTGNQRSYLLRYQTTAPENFIFEFSRTGASDIIATPGADFIATVGVWVHVVITGTEDLGSWYSVAYMNGQSVNDNLSGGGGALFNSTAAFQIGAHSGAANFFNGQAAQCFLCAATLSPEFVFSVFQETRSMFGI